MIHSSNRIKRQLATQSQSTHGPAICWQLILITKSRHQCNGSLLARPCGCLGVGMTAGTYTGLGLSQHLFLWSWTKDMGDTALVNAALWLWTTGICCCCVHAPLFNYSFYTIYTNIHIRMSYTSDRIVLTLSLIVIFISIHY